MKSKREIDRKKNPKEIIRMWAVAIPNGMYVGWTKFVLEGRDTDIEPYNNLYLDSDPFGDGNRLNAFWSYKEAQQLAKRWNRAPAIVAAKEEYKKNGLAPTPPARPVLLTLSLA